MQPSLLGFSLSVVCPDHLGLPLPAPLWFSHIPLDVGTQRQVQWFRCGFSGAEEGGRLLGHVDARVAPWFPDLQ